MVCMSFRLTLDNPISSVEYVFPDSFILRVKGRTFIERVIEFDFKVYDFRIADGYNIDCTGRFLDDCTFEASEGLMDMLSERAGVQWAGVFVHCGVDPTQGNKVCPKSISNVVIYDESTRYALPDFTFEHGSGKTLSENMVRDIKGIMKGLVDFCSTNFHNSDGDLLRLYESGNRIYVRTTSGMGFYYEPETDAIGFVVHNGYIKGVDAAKGLLIGAIEGLNTSIPFPVNCISISLSEAESGYSLPSKRESCAYDIFLE